MEDQGYLAHQIFGGLLTHINPANAHAAGLHIPETCNQPGDRRLPTPRWTNQGTHAALRDMEGKITENRGVRIVAEGHIIEANITRSAHRCGGDRFGQFGSVHDLVDVVHLLAAFFQPRYISANVLEHGGEPQAHADCHQGVQRIHLPAEGELGGEPDHHHNERLDEHPINQVR